MVDVFSVVVKQLITIIIYIRSDQYITAKLPYPIPKLPISTLTPITHPHTSVTHRPGLFPVSAGRTPYAHAYEKGLVIVMDQ